MTQYPPGYPPPPPGYGPPPPGNFAFPQGYPMPGAPSRLSAAAVCSLVCGLLLCIPGVTSIIAIITGFVGLGQTRLPNVRGRGLAVAGLILGVLGLVLWILFGSASIWVYSQTAPERAFCRTYITQLAAGNINQCLKDSAGSITRGTLDAEYKKTQGWGALQEVKVLATPIMAGGPPDSTASAVCRFSGSAHVCRLDVQRDSNGQLTVTDLQWQN